MKQFCYKCNSILKEVLIAGGTDEYYCEVCREDRYVCNTILMNISLDEDIKESDNDG